MSMSWDLMFLYNAVLLYICILSALSIGCHNQTASQSTNAVYALCFAAISQLAAVEADSRLGLAVGGDWRTASPTCSRCISAGHETTSTGKTTM